MLVHEVMTSDVVSVGPEATLMATFTAGTGEPSPFLNVAVRVCSVPTRFTAVAGRASQVGAAAPQVLLALQRTI